MTATLTGSVIENPSQVNDTMGAAQKAIVWKGQRVPFLGTINMDGDKTEEDRLNTKRLNETYKRMKEQQQRNQEEEFPAPDIDGSSNYDDPLLQSLSPSQWEEMIDPVYSRRF